MLDRACAEAFTGRSAPVVLLALMFATLATTSGLALAAMWIGVVLLVGEARKSISSRVRAMPPTHAFLGELALDTTRSTSLALAPALAWQSSAELAPAIAILLLAVVAYDAAATASRGRAYALLSNVPLAALGLRFAADAGAFGAFWTAAMGAVCVGYIAARALFANYAASCARALGGESVRQTNMSRAPGAAWEIDYRRGLILGGDALAAVIGRSATYRDIVDRACFAPATEQDLVLAAFAPAPGAPRRIALEHDVMRVDGTRVRVRHDGFLHTLLDGAPDRLVCATRLSAVDDAALPFLQTAVRQADETLAAQATALSVLQNELGHAERVTLASPMAPPADGSATATAAYLGDLLNHIERRRCAVFAAINGLVRARHDADTANLAKSQFLANMSHELRTPLNAIIGYAEMLQEDADDAGDASTAQDLARILAAGRHLLSLLNEVLDLSKIEAGRMDVAAAPFDVADMLEDLVETVRPLAARQNNTLALTTHAIRTMANTDATKLQQCVMNFLSNACKFTQNGRIEIAFDRRRDDHVDQLFITVRDSGIGMSRTHMSRLFQPFV